MKIFFQCIELVNEYQRKHKEKLRKEAHERYQNLSEEEKEKRAKIPKADTKIFLKKKKKESVSISKNVI